MPNVILQPASGAGALEHFKKTIEIGISLEDISQYLSAQNKNNLKAIYQDTPLQVWGIVSGERNINLSKWLRISPGDIVFFCQSGYLVAKAIVTYKMSNKPLAINLWGYNDKEQTWEYVYFVNDFEEIKIPIKKLNKIVGYKENFPVYGVMVLDAKKTEEVLSNFGSVESFLKEVGIEEDEALDEKKMVENYTPIDEIRAEDWDEIIKKIEEQVKSKPLLIVKRVARHITRNAKLSRALKQKYKYTCQVCGAKGFLKRSGEPYAEVHHIIGVGKGGADLSHNLLVVCASCHRKLEYAKSEFDDEKGIIKINEQEFKIKYLIK